jgi:hypothetical protein
MIPWEICLAEEDRVVCLRGRCPTCDGWAHASPDAKLASCERCGSSVTGPKGTNGKLEAGVP